MVFSEIMCKMRKNIRAVVILALTVLIVCSVWRFRMREGLDVKKECIDDELNKGKYMSDLQMFTNYGDNVKIDQCKEYTKAEMYSRWEESNDKIESCDHYSDKWYDINKRIIQKECGNRFLTGKPNESTPTPAMSSDSMEEPEEPEPA